MYRLLDLLAGIVTETYPTEDDHQPPSSSSASSSPLGSLPLFPNCTTSIQIQQQRFGNYLPYWNITNQLYTHGMMTHGGGVMKDTTMTITINNEDDEEDDTLNELFHMDTDIYRIGKSYFDNKEYARTVHWFDNIYSTIKNNNTNNNNGTYTSNNPSSTLPSTAWFRRRQRILMSIFTPTTVPATTLPIPSHSSIFTPPSMYSLQYPPRAYFLRCYALYLDGESKKEAERLQGTVNNPSTLTGNSNDQILTRGGTKVPVNQYLMNLYNDLSTVATNLATHLQSLQSSSSSSSSTRPVDPTTMMSDNSTNSSTLPPSSSSVSLSTNIHYLSSSVLPYLDPFCTYLLGIILRDLERKEEAKVAFITALQKFPLNWSAWYDLTKLFESKMEIDTVVQQYFASSSSSSAILPHWIYSLYQAYSYIEVHANTSALRLLQSLSGIFPHSVGLKALVARGLYNIRRFEPAHTLFRSIRYQDPYRIEDMDIYSNILYVKGDTPGLASLAHDVHGIGRYTYTPQCCCVIGNYFSARREHERAIIYFRRALRLDRQYTAAWTLMGHEYLELKNTTASIECYRRAVDTNPRDYRAWYGLGQTYELLHMFLYAAYYYRRTTALRPTDGRMWFALGSCYEHLERRSDAIACYERASNTDHDRDGAAAIKLAKLYRTGGNIGEAAKWYASYLEERELIQSPVSMVQPVTTTKDETNGKLNVKNGNVSSITSMNSGNSNNNNNPDVLEALLYLAKLAKDQKRWNDAEIYIQKLISLPSSTEIREARILLAEIRTARTLDQRVTQLMDQTSQDHSSVHNDNTVHPKYSGITQIPPTPSTVGIPGQSTTIMTRMLTTTTTTTTNSVPISSVLTSSTALGKDIASPTVQTVTPSLSSYPLFTSPITVPIQQSFQQSTPSNTITTSTIRSSNNTNTNLFIPTSEEYEEDDMAVE